MKPVKLSYIALAAAVLSAGGEAAAQQANFPLRAESPAREAFVKSQRDGCIQGITYGPMTGFCDCYARALADTISGEEQTALVAGQIPDSLHKKLRRIGAECKATFFR